MNRLHRIFTTLIIMSLGLIAVYAQEGMSIAGEIKMMPTDNDARIGDTRVWDQNRTLCALIKVVTTANYLTFDNGELGIVKAEQKKKQSEWWVYVPEGTEKLKITHPQYGQLNTNTEDGFTHFAPLEKATVYRLELRTPQMDALEQIDLEGFLILETQPDGAQVSIIRYGEEVYKGETPLQQEFHYGSYTYVISKSGYRDEEGVLVIDQDQVELSKNLVPLINVSQADSSHDSGRLRIITYPYYAEISVDNIPLGTTPRTLHLPVGEYEVMLSKQGYDTLYRHVNIAADSLTLIDEQLMAQERVNVTPATPVTDKEYEEIQAELIKERAELIEKRRKHKEWLKSISSPIQPRFEQMLLADFSWIPGEYVDAALGLNYIAGYRINNTFFLGAGVGFLYDFNGDDGYHGYIHDLPEYLNGSYYQFPLFGYLRVYFTGGKPVQFYMGAMAGYIFEPDAESEFRSGTYGNYVYEYVPYNASSFFFSPGMGINIRTSSKFGLDVSVSYYGRNALWYSNSQQFNHRWDSGMKWKPGIKFNLGITF